mgnify:CR=1 FL=1
MHSSIMENRIIKLECLPEKDNEAIKIGKLNNINNFALSFTNSLKDVKYFMSKQSCDLDLVNLHYLVIDEDCDTIEDIVDYEYLYGISFGERSSKKLMVLPDLTPLIGYYSCDMISF